MVELLLWLLGRPTPWNELKDIWRTTPASLVGRPTPASEGGLRPTLASDSGGGVSRTSSSYRSSTSDSSCLAYSPGAASRMRGSSSGSISTLCTFCLESLSPGKCNGGRASNSGSSRRSAWDCSLFSRARRRSAWGWCVTRARGRPELFRWFVCRFFGTHNRTHTSFGRLRRSFRV